MRKEEYDFWKNYHFGLVSQQLNSKEELIINKFDMYLDKKIPANEFSCEAEKCGGLEIVLANPALINFFANQYMVENDLIKIRIYNLMKNKETKKAR